jgi:hypothetical protein
MNSTPDEEHYQAFRVVYKDRSTYFPAPESENFQVECRYDKSIKKYIILWDDIMAIHKDILFIRNGQKTVSNIRDDQFQMYGII